VNYEVKIGWRYLYGGKREKLMQLLAVAVLALSDEQLSGRLVAFREAQTRKILEHPDPSAG